MQTSPGATVTVRPTAQRHHAQPNGNRQTEASLASPPRQPVSYHCRGGKPGARPRTHSAVGRWLKPPLMIALGLGVGLTSAPSCSSPALHPVCTLTPTLINAHAAQPPTSFKSFLRHGRATTPPPPTHLPPASRLRPVFPTRSPRPTCPSCPTLPWVSWTAGAPPSPPRHPCATALPSAPPASPRPAGWSTWQGLGSACSTHAAETPPAKGHDHKSA